MLVVVLPLLLASASRLRNARQNRGRTSVIRSRLPRWLFWVLTDGGSRVSGLYEVRQASQTTPVPKRRVGCGEAHPLALHIPSSNS